MKTQFTLTKRRCTLAAAFFLFIVNTGCMMKTARPIDCAKLSANPTEDRYLKQILSCRNEDSVIKCVNADYHENKYYIFRTSVPGDEKFDSYLADFAKQNYQLTLVNCGFRSSRGACCYNAKMGEFFAKAKIKSLQSIYLEAKDLYNRELVIAAK
jgi:hypothetical protein